MNLKSLNAPKSHNIISALLEMIFIHALWVVIFVGRSNSPSFHWLQSVKLVMINLEQLKWFSLKFTKTEIITLFSTHPKIHPCFREMARPRQHNEQGCNTSHSWIFIHLCFLRVLQDDVELTFLTSGT